MFEFVYNNNERVIVEAGHLNLTLEVIEVRRISEVQKGMISHL